MVDTKAFYDCLCRNGFDFFTGVPDSLLKDLCACIQENTPAGRHVAAANEGNAVAVAAGYHVATGRYGVVYMQNSGQGNALNPLLSLADEAVYRIPLLLIVGWRGQPGLKDEPQHIKQGSVTLAVFEAAGIAHRVLTDDFEGEIAACREHMARTGSPFALVVKKGSFSPYKALRPPVAHRMLREEALVTMIGALPKDALIVSTTGKTSREIYEIRERRGEGHARDFLTVGSMGHTASIALGMSLGTKKDIYCIDGDGSFLMHMGSLCVAAQHAGGNFKYILVNNGAHESVGGQPTVAFDVDVRNILKAAGFRRVIVASTREETARGMAHLKKETLCAMVVYTGQGSRDDLGRPAIPPERNKNDMMRLLLEDARK